ncbi:MAG: mechanosensitive ion channel family protein, partial [Nanoarchaeota archaeon]
WGHHMSTRKGALFSDEILPLAQSASKILFLLIGLFIILEYWGVQVWTMIASVGVLGIILGLALQDSLSNIFSGISLILDRTFKHGDIIKLESGEIGEVVMINLRSTRIKTFEHYIISIPNRVLGNTKVINMTQPSNLVRMTLTVGVGYDTDVDKVSKILSEAAGSVKGVDKTPSPDVMLTKLNEYSLDFDITFLTHITSVKHIENIKEQVLREVYTALKKHKISIPYPTRISISVPAGKEERRKELKTAREKM